MKDNNKMKPQRQAHRATNTFTFRGFGERVRRLRVSAGKFLLQRPRTEEGEETTFLHQALAKARELNLTQAFQDVQSELGGDLQSLAQLVHQEHRLGQCLARHLADPDTTALQPLLDLLVALASDLPTEFYQGHFYRLLPVLVGQLASREPERLEAVFLCLASLMVVVQRHLRADLHRLYHHEGYAALLAYARPWYINELAAQTLSFLVRKASGQEAFLQGVMKGLGQGPACPQGVGRLLAAMMKSDVVQRLHSSAGATLAILLGLLGDGGLPRGPPLESITYAVVQVAHHVTAKHPDGATPWPAGWAQDAALVWPVVWQAVGAILPATTAAAAHHLEAVMQVAEAWVTYKQALLVTEPLEALAQCLAVAQCQVPEEVGTTVCNVVVVLLTSPHHHIPNPSLRHSLHTLLASPLPHTTKITLVEQLFGLPSFDSQLLPEVLLYLDSLAGGGAGGAVQQQVLATLATLVLGKQPPCNSGMDLPSWKPYPLAFPQPEGGGEAAIPALLEDRLKAGLDQDMSNLEDLALCLLVVPHVSPLDHQALAPYLTWALALLLDSLTDPTHSLVLNHKPAPVKKKGKAKAEVALTLDLNVKCDLPLATRRALALLGVLVEAMAHVLSGADLLACLEPRQLVEVALQRPHYRANAHFLRALDLHLTVCRAQQCGDVMTQATLREVYAALAPCLASPHPQARLLVLHIFSLFPVTLAPPPEDAEAPESVFQVMLRAECVAVTPWEYKNRLRHLSSLDADHVAPHTPSCGSFREAPLLLLLGQLYINFKDMWEPALKGIATYARSLPDTHFWPLWFSQLCIASHHTRQVLQGKEVDPDQALSLEEPLLEEELHRLAAHQGFAKIPLRPDHLNYRNLLWRAMALFPGVCEARNRDVVPLFFLFLEAELYPADSTVAPTQDLTHRRTQGHTADPAQATTQAGHGQGQDADGGDREARCAEGHETQASRGAQALGDTHNDAAAATAVPPRRAPIKSLCEQLTVLSKFHNPRMVLHSQRLEDTYNQLLSHPLPGVQRLALDCLMSYGHGHLTPYREGLYNILDDRSFKHALTLFSIDGSEQSLEEEHRAGLLPCLLRLLYGKMYHKTGPNTAGRGKVAARKAVVLRFLAGAREAELGTFLDLAFEAVAPHLHGPPLTVVARATAALDPRQTVPPSRLLSVLTTVQNVVDKIGNLLEERIPHLLKVTLYVASLADGLLGRRAQISPRHVALLKHLRQLAQRQVATFFTQFADYPWSGEEVEAVFEACVWPGLARLPDEGLASPSPLLGLFSCWAQHPRYMPLLARHHPSQPSLTPLPYLVALLRHPKCSEAVAAAVLGLVEDLLTLADPDPADLQPLPPGPHMIPVEHRPSRDGGEAMNYGTALLGPHLDGLLQSLGSHLAKVGQGKAVATRDLTILTSLTRWVVSAEVSAELLNLIVPVVAKKQVKQEEKVAQLLAACCHLLAVVPDPQHHLRPLTSLLGWVAHRQAREHLCLALGVLAGRSPGLHHLATTAQDLNAWSPRAVEEVDFERRLACYSALTPVLAGQDTLDLPLSLLLVHHNMFVLQHQEDAALRDVAALCLTQLVEACARLQHSQRAVAKEVVVDRLLPLVRTALRGEREAVRLETVAVLRQVVHACPGLHPQLADLHQLADLEDEEVDFFSNLQHIQRHRRSRALTRLVERVRGGTLSLAPDTLTAYILPLAAPYLFKDEYVGDEYLMGSCVATVGAVAAQLPWHPYQRLLRYYLGLMLKGELKHLRLGVKVIDAILGAFHEEVEECAWQGKAKEGRKARRQRQAEARAGEQEEAGHKQKDKATATAKQGVKGEHNKDPKVEDAEEEKEEEEEEDAGKEENEGEDPSAVPLRRPQKVYRALVGSVIPQIQRTLGLRMRAETEHKLNRSRFPEDEDIKRIPLAFALIKLLRKMPRPALNAHVNGVLMKIITFLKCKAEGIREEARNMLVRIMVELGGHYLAWLVNDMRAILTRGFQTHVLVYTLHAVLHTLRPTLTAENVDACTAGVVAVCREDLLGVQAEEKKVKEITGKVKEARGDRSYDILGFVAEHVSAQGLREVMVPLTEVLSQTQDRQVVAKMARCLARVAAGLQRNQNVDVTQKSLFVYGIMNEKLPEMRVDGAEKKPRRKGKVERADSFLLLPEPQRARLTPKTSLKATAHILLEFALQLLCSLMRQGQLLPSDPAHAALLDPYLASMTRCINSDHPEVSIQALKCVNWLVKFPLPSLHTELKKICTQMFVVLHKYSSPELARGKLYDLVQLSFKSLAGVVRSVDAHMLSQEELEVLLGYVTSCLEDTRQQQTAFGVLQAVLSRKVDCPSLHQLLGQVKQMSITCGRSFPLQQARVTYHTYLLTYPMKPQRITTNIHYFLDNVAFPVEEGRLSAATMIHAVTANFPAKLITRQLETDLWFKVAEQLAKEHSREVRTLLHKILRTLFERSVRREVLLDLCLKLLAEPPGAAPDHMALQVAAKSLSAFLDVPVKLLPKSLLSAVLPQVSTLVQPARYTTTTTTLEACGDVQQMDTTLVCLLEVLGKLAGAFLPHPEWSVHAGDQVWESVQSHLSYPHLHVRVSVAGLVGQLLAAHPVEGDTSPPLAATPQAAMELAKALCELLRTQAGTETHLLTQLSLAAVRNLIYLIRQSLKVPLGRHTPRTDSCVRQEGKQQQQQPEVNGEDEAKDVTSEPHEEDLKAARADKSKHSGSKEGKMSAKRSKGLTETKTKRRRTGSGGREEQSDGDSSPEATEPGQGTPTEPHHGGHTGGGEGGAGRGRDTGATGDRRPLVTAAVWVLHQVGNIAYEELQTSGSERTVTREALLNLMAGLIMVAGEDAKAPRLLTYIIKHLARELTDDHLPEPLKERTREVAGLVKEKVGVETYTRHLSAAQTALARKRLDRRAHEMQQKVVNPELAQRRKRKKQDNLKDNRKRRIAERKGKVVKGGKGAKGLKGKAMTSKKRNMMDEVVVRE